MDLRLARFSARVSRPWEVPPPPASCSLAAALSQNRCEAGRRTTAPHTPHDQPAFEPRPAPKPCARWGPRSHATCARLADMQPCWAPEPGAGPNRASDLGVGTPVFVRPPCAVVSASGACSRVELTFRVPAEGWRRGPADWQLYTRGLSKCLQPIMPSAAPAVHAAGAQTLLTYRCVLCRDPGRGPGRARRAPRGAWMAPGRRGARCWRARGGGRGRGGGGGRARDARTP